MIISHRGKYEHSPFSENSIEALTSALKQSYIGGVEFDVRMTKDHILVIHHNMTIDHTSDGTGILSTMTLNELYQYNFGTKKHPSKIATLQNFLDVIDTDKVIMIELKNGMENDAIFVQKIEELIRQYRHLNIKICSFSESLLKKIQPISALGKITFFSLKQLPKHLAFYSIYYKNIEKGISFPYYIWTIQNKKELEQVLSSLNKNCQGIITDVPRTVFQFIHKHRDNHHISESLSL